MKRNWVEEALFVVICCNCGRETVADQELFEETAGLGLRCPKCWEEDEEQQDRLAALQKGLV